MTGNSTVISLIEENEALDHERTAGFFFTMIKVTTEAGRPQLLKKSILPKKSQPLRSCQGPRTRIVSPSNHFLPMVMVSPMD